MVHLCPSKVGYAMTAPTRADGSPDPYDPAWHQDDGHGGCVICLFYIPHTDDTTERVRWPCAVVREAEARAEGAAAEADTNTTRLREWIADHRTECPLMRERFDSFTAILAADEGGGDP